MTGRPTKFTPELGARIVDLVRRGHYKSVAARACGIDESTLYEWLAIGDREAAETGDIDPNAHTRAELVAIAEARGVPVSDGWTKPRLAATLGSKRSQFSQFSRDLREAETAAEVVATEMMIETGRGDWRFWRDYLARTRPERWGNVAARPYEPEVDSSDMPAGTVDPEAVLVRASEVRLKVLEGGRDDKASGE